jgi:hypothetical protein
MILSEYEAVTTRLLTLAKSIVDKKRPDYTIGNKDVLKNFKSVGERLGLTPLQVWGIYFLKHIDAISSFAKGNKNPSEPIEMRFADALNYLFLGMALIEEGVLLDSMEAKTVAVEALLAAHRERTELATTHRERIEKSIWQGSDLPLLKHIPITYTEEHFRKPAAECGCVDPTHDAIRAGIIDANPNIYLEPAVHGADGHPVVVDPVEAR